MLACAAARAAALGLLVLAAAGACSREQKAPSRVAGLPIDPATSREAERLAEPYVDKTQRPGLAEYRDAGDAVTAGDVERAIGLLERSVNLDPAFAEAWYQLGAARSNLAVDSVDRDEARAVALFRDAVTAKRRAKSLFLLGKATLWSDEELRQSEIALEQALADVDEILVSDERVAESLRIYAAAGRPRP